MNGVSHSRLSLLKTAPNILTLARICLAPFLVAAILQGEYFLSFMLFIAAGLTDALDGTLARVLKQRSVLGQYLDPVADKLLLSTLFLVLMHKGLIPVTVTVLVFGRDVGILLVAAILYAAVGRRDFPPSVFGKANTLAQIVAVAAVLLRQLTSAAWVVKFRHGALYATMILTVASGLHYAWLASRRLAASMQTARRPNNATGEVRRRHVDLFGLDGVFDFHVTKLFGIKDFATIQALDEFSCLRRGKRFEPWDVCRR